MIWLLFVLSIAILWPSFADGTQFYSGKCSKHRCYYLSKGRVSNFRTFDQAKSICKSKNWRLAMIESREQNEFVNAYLQDTLYKWEWTTEIYIDGYEKYKNIFLFANGAHVKYFNNLKRKDYPCFTIFTARTNWVSSKCNHRLYYLCEKVTTTMVAKPYCNEGKCYHISMHRLMFEEAQRECEKRGYRILTIDGDNQFKFVSDSVNKHHHAEFWINGFKIGNTVVSDWKYDDEETRILYRNWDKNQPNFYDKREKCLEANDQTKQRINDIYCNFINYYVCEENINILKTTKKCLRNKCYRISNMKTTYNMASGVCKLHGMKLAKVTGDIQKDLTTFLKYMAQVEYFIDGKFEEATRRWWTHDGKEQLDYFNWRYKPNTPNEKCILINPTDGKWNSAPCSRQLAFICEGSII